MVGARARAEARVQLSAGVTARSDWGITRPKFRRYAVLRGAVSFALHGGRPLLASRARAEARDGTSERKPGSSNCLLALLRDRIGVSLRRLRNPTDCDYHPKVTVHSGSFRGHPVNQIIDRAFLMQSISRPQLTSRERNRHGGPVGLSSQLRRPGKALPSRSLESLGGQAPRARTAG